MTLIIIIDCLQKTFEITVGEVINFIGLQIERDLENKSLFIHRSDYIKKIIVKFNMSDAKAVSVPANPHTILYPSEKEETFDSYVPFRKTVGLLFIATIFGPNITYVIN